jgi:vacuolar-type H+-ATPase subunit I/STV1
MGLLAAQLSLEIAMESIVSIGTSALVSLLAVVAVLLVQRFAQPRSPSEYQRTLEQRVSDQQRRIEDLERELAQLKSEYDLIMRHWTETVAQLSSAQTSLDSERSINNVLETRLKKYES